MATNIPPHNLDEVIAATIALIDEPALSIDELMQYIPGPDFPTHGIINGSSGTIEAYRTGRGRIPVRAKAEIETESNGRGTIFVHDIRKAAWRERGGNEVQILVVTYDL